VNDNSTVADLGGTPEFTTIETFTIARRGTVHVVENPADIEPRMLVDRFVLLDGVLRNVTAVETPAVFWAPGMKASRHLGLLVRE